MASNPGIVAVHGFALEPFQPLADIFGWIVGMQGRGGAAIAIYRGGELAVDLTSGAYRTDALSLLLSATKVATAIAAAHAHDRGRIDLDAPLADYWHAFDRASTARITLRSVLAHQSGLAA